MYYENIFFNYYNEKMKIFTWKWIKNLSVVSCGSNFFRCITMVDDGVGTADSELFLQFSFKTILSEYEQINSYL